MAFVFKKKWRKSMREILQKIIEIEWIAQSLLYNIDNIGPKIEIVQNLKKGNPDFKSSEYDHILAIQGSFDPPLYSHLELIEESIELYEKQISGKKTALLILISPAHVEKYIDLTTRSLLGVRVLLLDLFLSELTKSIDILIGVSNIPLYIDLNKAIPDLFSTQVKVSYIMGLDVFTKLFDQKYYSKPLEEVLIKLFEADFLVAGRQEISTREQFIEMLQELPKIAHKAFHENNSIQFVNLSKKYQYSSSTAIRTKLTSENEQNIPLINPEVLKFLKTYQIYRIHSEITLKQIIIQQIVRFAISDNAKINDVHNILSDIFLDVKTNQICANKIIREYKTKENSWLKERYNWPTPPSI